MNKFKFSLSLVAISIAVTLTACGDDHQKERYSQPEYQTPAAQYQQPVAPQQPIIINNVPPAVQHAPGVSEAGTFLLGAMAGAVVGNILSQPPMQPRYAYESERDFYARQRQYHDIDRAYAEKNSRYIAQLERDASRSKNADLQHQLAAVKQQNRDLKAQAAAPIVPPQAQYIPPKVDATPIVPMQPPAVITSNTQAVIPKRVDIPPQKPIVPAAATGAYSQPNRIMPTQIKVNATTPSTTSKDKK